MQPISTQGSDISLQEQNKAIVRRFNTAFIQDSDISAFHEIIDPAVVNHTAPPGFSKGADGMYDVIELFRNALTGLKVNILRQVAEGDVVVTHKTFNAVHTGPLMGIPPSGQPVTITIIDIVRLHNGKYVEHWGIRDVSGIRIPSQA
jgi:predicted ester cyclase